ncbi:hypothetical protein ACFUAG_04180 [Streptomyces sp. NPDC057193]|uniref:hypothetical protein n=1 Tax=Streptomyces sp. NPDC057193 TaxID=3346043 RepID=UPI00362E740B
MTELPSNAVRRSGSADLAGLGLVTAFTAHREIRSIAEGAWATAELLLPEPVQPGCQICR